MKLIDTNIFIYASGKPHPFREKSQHVLKQVMLNPAGFNISSEILQEILHVYSNKNSMKKGIKLVETVLKIFPQVFPITTKDQVRIVGVNSSLIDVKG
jgi:predicted nucleic acid-binding protein